MHYLFSSSSSASQSLQSYSLPLDSFVHSDIFTRLLTWIYLGGVNESSLPSFSVFRINKFCFQRPCLLLFAARGNKRGRFQVSLKGTLFSSFTLSATHPKAARYRGGHAPLRPFTPGSKWTLFSSLWLLLFLSRPISFPLLFFFFSFL